MRKVILGPACIAIAYLHHLLSDSTVVTHPSFSELPNFTAADVVRVLGVGRVSTLSKMCHIRELNVSTR